MKPPKPVALGMVVHHLTRSEELLTMLNRLEHCIAPTQVLEIDTALAENELSSQERASLPTNTIDCPVQYSVLTIMTSV